MYSFLATVLASVFMQVQQFFLNMDSSYLDIIKIFAGSIGWIGSLTLYMWWKEKHKFASVRINQEK